MKNSTIKLIIGVSIITLNGLSGCKKKTLDIPTTLNESLTTIESDNNSNARIVGAATIDSSVFFNGAFNLLKIKNADLKNLGGSIAGVPLAVSNNPEKINTTGWLFKNPTLANATAKMPLTGKFNLYLYHYNNTGAPIYIHVIVSNPNSTAINLNTKGVVYTSSNYSGNGGKGFGPSYKIAENWLNGLYTHNATGQKINAYLPNLGTVNYASVATVLLNSTKTIDGRFEFEALSAKLPANCYVYVIASTSSNTATAFNLAQTNVQATGNFLAETPSTFGRECGIYNGSEWKGLTTINLPNRAGYVGISFNTSQKNSILQNQNASALGVISGSSSFTYGNYGMGYIIDLRFVNIKNTKRTVNVYLVHSATNPARANMTWHAPMKINNNPLLETYTTLNNNKQLISTFNLAAGSASNSASSTQKIKLYVPGLISANMQLVAEVN